MARLLFKALRVAGFAPSLESPLRTWDGAGDPDFQARMRQASDEEAERLVAHWSVLPQDRRPRLWFTYHVYYKAPDWLGPRCADVLGIPYVVAEGSRAGKRAKGAWALAHRGAEAALDRADAIFVITKADREALERARRPGQRLIDLPPFLDPRPWQARIAKAEPHRRLRRNALAPVRLLTVAMMRPGDKLNSYRILAEALTPLTGRPWLLDIVGDGDARDTVRQLFAPFGACIRFHGRIDGPDRLGELYGNSDLFVWPAVNEAYGMALLEAQLCGCPVLAGAYGGVASVVQDGRTGVLVRPGDPATFTRALDALLREPARRQELGRAAQAFVRDERSLEQASATLGSTLTPLAA